MQLRTPSLPCLGGVDGVRVGRGPGQVGVSRTYVLVGVLLLFSGLGCGVCQCCSEGCCCCCFCVIDVVIVVFEVIGVVVVVVLVVVVKGCCSGCRCCRVRGVGRVGLV